MFIQGRESMLSSIRDRRGFSLLETAIVIGIAGLLVAALAQEYQQYVIAKVLGTTGQNANTLQAQLAAHMLVFGYLPCPAAPAFAPGVIGPDQAGTLISAGQGDCSIGTANQFTNTTACDPLTRICTTPGHRASPAGLNFNGNNPTINDPVLIGSVPWVDLGISVNNALDGYGNRFTYAVSYYDTQLSATQWGNSQTPGISPNQFGAINIESYNSTTTPQISASFYSATSATYPNVPGTYMLAVVSHGPDGMGAWNYYGQQPHPCLSGGSAPNYTNGLDVENCNGDNTFLLNGSNVNNSTGNMYSTVPGANHYDDSLVIYDINFSVDLWSVEGSIGTMTNNLGGNVGIGNQSPAYSLDVTGNIQIDNGLQVSTLCDQNGNNCMPTNNILNTGMLCNGGGLVTAISNNSVQCTQQINLGTITPATCPTGQYATGITATGSLVCAP